LCKVYQNIASLQRYYNTGKSSSVTADPSAGISNLVITNQNGTLSCSFRREKIMPGIAHYFNLNNPTYVLMSQGSVSGGMQYIVKFII
jgi:hypothetical protein